MKRLRRSKTVAMAELQEMTEQIWKEQEDYIIYGATQLCWTAKDIKAKLAARGFLADDQQIYVHLKKWGVRKKQDRLVTRRICQQLFEDAQNGQASELLPERQITRLERHCREGYEDVDLDRRQAPGRADIIRGVLRMMRTYHDAANQLRADIVSAALVTSAALTAPVPLIRPEFDMYSLENEMRGLVMQETGDHVQDHADIFQNTYFHDPVGSTLDPNQVMDDTGNLSLLHLPAYFNSRLANTDTVLRVSGLYFRQQIDLEAQSRNAPGVVTIDGQSPILYASKVFWRKVQNAFYWLKTTESPHLAEPEFKAAARMVNDVCSHQSFMLLIELFTTLSPALDRPDTMSTRSGLGQKHRKELIFAIGWSTQLQCKDPSHPLVFICKSLLPLVAADDNDAAVGGLERGLQQEVAVRALDVMLDVLITSQALPFTHQAVFDIHLAVVRLYRRTFRLFNAQMRCDWLIGMCESQESFGRDHINTCFAISEKVYILNEQKRYTESLELAEEVLRRTLARMQSHGYGQTISLEDQIRDKEGLVWAYEDVAEIKAKWLGRLDAGIDALTAALPVAMEVWSNDRQTEHVREKLYQMEAARYQEFGAAGVLEPMP